MSDTEAGEPSFPTDGINRRQYFDRPSAVQRVISLAKHHQHLVLGSPPSTGKTSLLTMAKWALEKKPGVSVHKRTLCQDDSPDQIKAWLASKDIVKDEEKLQQLQGEMWILLDDAHNLYNEESDGLWQFIVKFVSASSVQDKLFFIISSTYDLSTGDSPVVFRNLKHFTPHMQRQEAELFYKMYTTTKVFENWDHYMRNLFNLACLPDDRYHVGMIIEGLKLLFDLNKSPRSSARSRPLDELSAVNELRGEWFILNLQRCFGLGMRNEFDAFALKHHIAAVIDPNTDVDLSTDKTVAPLFRAGILNSQGQFSCRGALWYFNRKCFANRAAIGPDSLDDLVVESVKLMSAKRFRDALNDGFPKEATFQHAFNETMCMLLPLHNYVVPEFNTFCIDSNGDPVHGELDFYINGSYQWCLELLRKGHKIGEHLARFDPKIGKYREAKPKEYLVVDCRGPKERSVKIDEARCTMYFADDFTSCVCKMRNQKEITISLQP